MIYWIDICGYTHIYIFAMRYFWLKILRKSGIKFTSLYFALLEMCNVPILNCYILWCCKPFPQHFPQCLRSLLRDAFTKTVSRVHRKIVCAKYLNVFILEKTNLYFRNNGFFNLISERVTSLYSRWNIWHDRILWYIYRMLCIYKILNLCEIMSRVWINLTNAFCIREPQKNMKT